MNVSNIASTLIPEGMTLYMFGEGPSDDYYELGPYLGPVGLDFDDLAKHYRTQLFESKKSSGLNHCAVLLTDFVNHLVAHEVIQELVTTLVLLDLDIKDDVVYQPSHWPKCPVCAEGRGRAGTSYSLRCGTAAYKRCVKCGHDWQPENEL